MAGVMIGEVRAAATGKQFRCVAVDDVWIAVEPVKGSAGPSSLHVNAWLALDPVCGRCHESAGDEGPCGICVNCHAPLCCHRDGTCPEEA